VTIQPADDIRALAKGLGSKVAIFENSPVVGLSRQKSGWRALTALGSVTAPKAIIGVNGHIEDFGFFRHRLMHIFTYAR
jgi:glycine/D-amino acid oxidase-like deaminating enzyme